MFFQLHLASPEYRPRKPKVSPPDRAPPVGERVVELFPGDPFPDYSADPVMDYDLCVSG